MVNLNPIAKERRHPTDYRDELEHAEIVAVLAWLPPDHIAVYAYYTAARCAADSIGLSHLIEDPYLRDRLVDAYFAAHARIWTRSPGHALLATPAPASSPRK